MTEHEKEIQLEGIVQASRYDGSEKGKQFLGAAVECSDGTVWVIDYSEQSPFHSFANRQVVAYGVPYEPRGQHLIRWSGGKKLRHFRVSRLRLSESTLNADLVEVGAGHRYPSSLNKVQRLLLPTSLREPPLAQRSMFGPIRCNCRHRPRASISG